jgi:hypothetical protein
MLSGRKPDTLESLLAGPWGQLLLGALAREPEARMDRTETAAYQQIMGTVGEIPLGVLKLHEQFVQVWRRMGNRQHSVPGEIMALISILGNDRPPRNGDPCYVDGAKGTYISKWKEGTVRIKFPKDDKAWRVVPEEQVRYD